MVQHVEQQKLSLLLSLLTFLCGVDCVLLHSLGDHDCRVHVAPADVDAVPEDGGGRRGGLAAAPDALVKVDQLPAVVQDVVGFVALQQAIPVKVVF